MDYFDIFSFLSFKREFRWNQVECLPCNLVSAEPWLLKEVLPYKTFSPIFGPPLSSLMPLCPRPLWMADPSREGCCSLPAMLTVMWLCFLINICTFGPSPKLTLRTPTSPKRREQHFTVKEKRAALHSKNSLLQKQDTTKNAILILTKSLEALSSLRCLRMLCRTSCSCGLQEKAVVSHSHYH